MVEQFRALYISPKPYDLPYGKADLAKLKKSPINE